MPRSNKNVYKVQNQWGGTSAPWHDGGEFEFGTPKKPLIALEFTSNDGVVITGTVTYLGTKPTEFSATRTKQNVYKVNGITWRLGARDAQNIVAMNILSHDGGRSFSGFMTYFGEGPIGFKSETGSIPAKPNEDFTAPYQWAARIDSIDDAIDGALSLLHSSIVTIDGFTDDKLIRLIIEHSGIQYSEMVSKSTVELTSHGSQTLWPALLDSLSSRGYVSLPAAEPEPSVLSAGVSFELKQILNIYSLLYEMNSRFWIPAQALIRTVLTTTDPPLNLIRTCLRCVGEDAEILERAILQRRWLIEPHETNREPVDAVNKTLNYKPSPRAQALLVADKLTLMALAPIQNLLPPVKAVTYFSHATYKHDRPYGQQYLLIGLSYDLINPSTNNSPQEIANSTTGEAEKLLQEPLPAFEIMAIPHEVGHYVYHHAKLPTSALDENRNRGTELDGKSNEKFRFLDLVDTFQSDDGNPNLYRRWCEELFADVYGCMIAGPLCAIGLQAILATGDTMKLWLDDGEHPIPILRPYILSEILRKLTDKSAIHSFKKAPDALDTNWSNILRNRGFELLPNNADERPQWVKLPSSQRYHMEGVVNIDAAMGEIEPIIDRYIELLIDAANPTDKKTVDKKTTDKEAANNTLSVPWTNEDFATVTNYYAEMEKLTSHEIGELVVPDGHLTDPVESGDGVAGAPGDTPANSKSSGETGLEQTANSLRELLNNWGYSGPTTHGDHPGLGPYMQMGLPYGNTIY